MIKHNDLLMVDFSLRLSRPYDLDTICFIFIINRGDDILSNTIKINLI